MSGREAAWQRFWRGFAEGCRLAGSSRRLKLIAAATGGMVGIGYFAALA